MKNSKMTKSLIIAGGCFWCIEAHMKMANGVLKATSGYSGGETENPTYENYASGDHREVVKVVYDPEVTSYQKLAQYYLKDIDPTDGTGSFGDRGESYAPAIYYETEEEKEIVEDILESLEESKLFNAPIKVDVLPRKPFWLAEEYHQNYAKKKPLQYSVYHKMSGREDFVKKHWSNNSNIFEVKNQNKFHKPKEKNLRERLTKEQYRVTQNAGTEKPFENEYFDNFKPGIYVDIVSGKPLFSSKDKFHSGTGWPSFSASLEPDNVITKKDISHGMIRTEVLSKHTETHLGHLFDDGPTTLEASRGAKPTGLRYCLNSASLRFIPKDKLEEHGYGKYRELFE